MRKSTLFISAAITTFVLAVLFGVVSAYQKNIQAAPVVATAAPAATLEPTLVPTPVRVSAEQAAALAAQFMNKQDLYSVEVSSYNEQPAYLVTFSSGDLVYVALDGQIVNVMPPQITVVSVPVPAPQPVFDTKAQNNNQPSVQQQTSGAHEDDHETEHEDDHD